MLFDLITVSKAHEHMQMRQQLKKLNVCVSSRIIVTLETGWQRTQAKTHVRGGDSCWRNISWCDELIQLYELFKYLLYVLCSIKDLIPQANLLILSLVHLFLLKNTLHPDPSPSHFPLILQIGNIAFPKDKRKAVFATLISVQCNVLQL